MVEMTPIEHAAWVATGRDQSSWAAVKRALAAVEPLIAADAARRAWEAADTAARDHDGRTVTGRIARYVANAVAGVEHEYYSAGQEARDV